MQPEAQDLAAKYSPARSHFLSATELAATKIKVAKVNQRARRRGFTGGFELTAVPAQRTIRTEAGTDRVICGFDVMLTGTAPSCGGWTFIAAVDAAPAGAVIRAAPGTPEIDPTTITPGACGHCGTSRNRRHTYLVRSDETGKVKQVGKTCMKDFLGWDVHPVFIDEESVSDDLFGGLGGLGGRIFDSTLIEVARLAFAATDALGYRGGMSEVPTRTVVASILDGAKGSGDFYEAIAGSIVDDEEEVIRRLEVVRSTLTEATGFEANLRTILQGDVVQRQHSGYAITVGLVYQKATSEAAEQAPEHISEWIGRVGEKITVNGTIASAMTIETQWGGSRLIVVSVGEGDRIKMFTSAAWAWDVEAGDELALTGTVKAHEEYRGRRETLLVRPKKS